MIVTGLLNFSPLPVTVVTLRDNNTSLLSDLRSEKDAGPRDLNFCPERPKSLTNKIVLNNKESKSLIIMKTSATKLFTFPATLEQDAAPRSELLPRESSFISKIF